MPSFIAVHRTTIPDQVPALVLLAEALLGHTIAAGITIRNVAVVPRLGRLYVYAEAPSSAMIAHLFAVRGLIPLGIVEADCVEWSRLIAARAGGVNAQWRRLDAAHAAPLRSSPLAG